MRNNLSASAAACPGRSGTPRSHPTRKRFPARLRLLLLRLGRLPGAAVRANTGVFTSELRVDPRRTSASSAVVGVLAYRAISFCSRRCQGSPSISRCARRSAPGERPTPSSSAHVCGEHGHRTPWVSEHRGDRGGARGLSDAPPSRGAGGSRVLGFSGAGFPSPPGARSRTDGLRESCCLRDDPGIELFAGVCAGHQLELVVQGPRRGTRTTNPGTSSAAQRRRSVSPAVVRGRMDPCAVRVGPAHRGDQARPARKRSVVGALGRDSLLVQRILQSWTASRRRRSMTRGVRRVWSSFLISPPGCSSSISA